MSKLTARNYRPTLSPIAQAVGLSLMVMAGLAPINSATAGAGWVPQTLSGGATSRLQTFVANSPSGDRDVNVAEGTVINPATGKQTTGKAIRKFVDPLPLVGAANVTVLSGDSTAIKYIPKAVSSKWVKPDGNVSGDDYFEIAVVEYQEKFHSDLAKATTLRGYVQIDHLASNSGGTAGLPGSLKYALTYLDGTPIMIAATDDNGKLTGGPKVQALAVDKPHYLGPMLSGTQGIPTRLKFHNLLPVGRATIQGGGLPRPDAVVTARNGDMFLPVDKSVLGAGYGPDGVTIYTQNRANIHLHGGDNPWISDGSPHQWITPAGEADAGHAPSEANPTKPLSLAAQYAAEPALYDPELLPNFLRGVSNVNVPDMYDPGPGASTYYYPNGQSARFLWIHDQTAGITRLNHYAGMVAPYELTDAREQALISDGTLPPAARTIPLIIEDKAFVPKDVSLQDGRWNTSAWGAEGDLWFSHVYESLQDPAQENGVNAVGRWYYGPLFWPIFPAMYDLPTGAYGDETITPESYHDTPVVNGVAYPTLNVDPTTYRFKVLNASVDRHITINLFEGKVTGKLADGTPVINPLGIASEVDMVQATVPLPAEACPAGQTRPEVRNTAGDVTGYCTPEHWPMDSRAGGVIAPSAAGPTLYQIANEGGWLPNVAAIDPSPTLYNTDKGRITIYNVEGPALVLTPAERADLVIDFSAYAGKTLILYNDAGAPEPGSDPRNNYFTGVGDQSGGGGAEDTKPGYGPNMRTMMQIKVANIAPAAALNVANLDTKIAAAYVASQPKPLVAQPAYAGFDAAWLNLSETQSYADIFTATLKEPSFKFTPGTPSAAFNSVRVLNPGTGYLKSPTVTFTPTNGQGSGATALATMKIDHLTVVNPGSGYITAPAVTIVANAGGGTGAMADARLAPNAMTVTNGGSGYTSAPTVNFPFPPDGATKPVAVATVSGGKVTSIEVTTPGHGYAAVPFPTFTGGGGTGASATMTAGIDAVHLFSPYPTTPEAVGGGGYTDFTQVAINLVGGTALDAQGNPLPGGAVVTASGRLFDISILAEGSGYTAPPVITIEAPPAGVGHVTATAEVDRAGGGAAEGSLLAQAKAVQELHDATYGRYNNTLGIELPFTGAFNQTTIPLGYVDTASEIVSDNETQLWKFTHNGLFNQAVHFRMFNVQLINRVGWDGFVAPPNNYELGWKETVRINPLEDTIVALRPKKPVLPGFGLPLSVRPADPTQPLGSPFGFTQIDPATGNPAAVVNDMVDYGWEYTIQNAIVSRAENDFIRPMIFHAKEAVPAAPSEVAVALTTGVANVTWKDNASTEYKFEIWRADRLPDTTVGDFTLKGNALANSGGYVDTTISTGGTNTSGGDAYVYKVVAVGGNGRAESSVAVTPLSGAGPTAPTGMTAVAQSDTAVRVSWQDMAANELGFLVERNVNGAGWTALPTATPVGNDPILLSNVGANTQSVLDTGRLPGQTVQYRIKAVNAAGYSAEKTATVTMTVPTMTTVSAAVNSPSQVTLTWSAPAVPPPSGYRIVRTGGTGPAVTYPVANTATTFVDTGLAQHTAYSYSVQPVDSSGAVPVYGTASVASATTYYAPVSTISTLTAVSSSPTNVTLSWTGGVPAVKYLVYRCEYSIANANCTNASTTWNAWVVPAPASGYADNTAIGNTTYRYYVLAINGTVANTTTVNKSNTKHILGVTTQGAPTAPTAMTAVAQSDTAVRVAWQDPATNESGFLVERSLDAGGTWTALNTPTQIGTIGSVALLSNVPANTQSIVDTGLATGQTVHYRIKAVNTGGYSAEATASATTLAVPAMTTVSPAVNSPSQLTLTWSRPTVTNPQALSGYRIVRTGGTGPEVTYSVADTATPTLVDSGLAQHTAYSYSVQPVNSLGAVPVYGTASVASATTYYAPVSTISTLTAVSSSPTNVTLSWTGGVPAVKYLVYRCEYSIANANCTNASTTWNAWVVPAPASGYADNTAIGNTTYRYYVLAINGTVANTTTVNKSNTKHILGVTTPAN